MTPEEIEARKAASAIRLKQWKLARALDEEERAEAKAAAEAYVPVHTNLWRDPLALAMLCAFNNVSSVEIKNHPEWLQFANPNTAAAWHRVADVAVRFIVSYELEEA